jgi:DNA-binding NarL/FixJ family response regulator
MRKLIEDTKQAITELIDQLYLESKRSTYCAMVVEMYSTGHTTKEISEQLEISENQVVEMLQAESVSRINRVGGYR